MYQTISAIRAITAVLFQRIFAPVMWVGGGVVVALYILAVYLSLSVHPLWWLLFVALIPLTIVLAALAATLWFLSNRLLPRPLLRGERQQLLGFADKIIRIAEVRATPLPVLVFLVAKDIVRGRRSSYVEEIIDDSKSLKDEMIAARALFERKTLG